MDKNPTKDLLEFYKNKSAEYEKDIITLTKKIEEIKKCNTNQLDFWQQIKEKNDDIYHLQALLNKVEICLLKEKESALRVSAENDQLRIKDIDNKKRIKALEIVLFSDQDGLKTTQVMGKTHKTIPSLALSKSRASTSGYNSLENIAENQNFKNSNPSKSQDKQIEMLQIKALKLEIEEQRRFITVHMGKIIDKNNQNENFVKEIEKREIAKQKNLVQRLSSTQELLCQTAKDLAELKKIYYKNEEIYKIKEASLRNTIIELRSQINHMKFSSNVNLLSDEDIFNDKTDTSSFDDAKKYRHGQKYNMDKVLEKKMKASQDSAIYYKEKYLDLENEHELLNAKYIAEHQIYSDRHETLTQRLKACELKYQNILKRRNFDKQGYQADTNILKDKVKQLERLLYRATINLGNETKNREILENMEQIAQDSKKMIHDETKSRLQLLEMEERLKTQLHDPNLG
ncbi:unnamed protein product [Gordionus sp. m RMFG-2023]|uniref:coiled-coil domain-containing protein 77-like n=1 Tax=Gordionus sp. m RMFG-2023 TaxID=3053472 RepID=UPI0030E40B67